MANSVNVQKKIEIFSGPQCNYCRQAKALLDEMGVNYTELDISTEEYRNEFVQRLPRTRSIPQVFVGGQHIGGYEDLQILKEKGQLEEVLMEV
ncbi:MAG: glutaredoxin 3 [Gammaproteobacteria bacterium]|nr:glutaredoxin 3 [Gammaproteobacteria bacterium]